MTVFQECLINWYQENHRDFPWRQDHDPYHIWISEIMLQQTTTETVIPYYQNFIEHFPTVDDLAWASLEDVYKMWEGLGYYRRAKHLHESAKMIVDQYQGVFPCQYEDIIALKGVGEYTAGAILSIAYFKPYPAVDGNVLRIISRVYLIKENIVKKNTQKLIYDKVKELLKGYDASSFNQALMDLGATICRPVHPRCSNCPIASFCKAREFHQQNVLPISIKKINHQEINYITGIITYQDQFFIIKNPPGLLENLYGFVQYEVESPYTFIERFKEEYGVELNIVSSIKRVKHVFTHRTWYMNVYHFVLNKPIEGLCTLEQLDLKPISTAHQKVLKAYRQSDAI